MSLWVKKVSVASYTRNSIFSNGCQKGVVTPDEALTGTEPDVSSLIEFG